MQVATEGDNGGVAFVAQPAGDVTGGAD